MGQPVSTPSGVTIRISAAPNGTSALGYLAHTPIAAQDGHSTGYSRLQLTADRSAAATWILEDGTGYLYLVDAADDSYYPMARVDAGQPA